MRMPRVSQTLSPIPDSQVEHQELQGRLTASAPTADAVIDEV
jgi:hypothetical protein